MAQRMGLGPVFAYEWLTRSRRWQAYALRGLFVVALLLGLWMVMQSAMSNTNLTVRQQLVQAGESFFYTMTIIQLALVMLAAPAATAGAICLDKARGTLAHVMVTDLTDREVILGKLAARLVPVLNLVACALPVAALGTLMGGIDPMALTAAFMIAAGMALLGCSLALALSVWMTKAHEVMIVVFALWSAWLLALPACMISSNGVWAPVWLKLSNPFWLSLAPYSNPRMTSLVEPVGFFLTCLGLSIGLAGLAVARLRPVYLHQANRVPKAIKDSRAAGWFRGQVRWWPGPSLDKNPVLWREWHRNRPSKVVRLVWGAYIVITSLISLKIIWDWSFGGKTGGLGREAASLFNAFQIVIGLLLLAASAGTVLSEERVRGSLDVLLSTPLSTSSIVWGKWWGAFRRVPWLAFWPALLVYTMLPNNPSARLVAFAYLIPTLIIVQGAALASLGLALATWISRTGRAITWTIAALVASVVGWPISAFLLFPRSGPNSIPQLVLIMGSPFWNVGMTTAAIEQHANRGGFNDPMEQGALVGLIVWGIAYASIALGLYLATLFTFDRCLGRTPERLGDPRGFRAPDRRIGQAAKSSIPWVDEFIEREVDRGEEVTA
jgi:ABC-type transport system involved in multi-copper enzyme maturation permease subunit